MNLLLDIGNTNLRWTLHGDGAVWEPQIVRHGDAIPLDLLAIWDEMPKPDQVVVSHVGRSGVADSLKRVLSALWRLEPEFVRTRAEFGGVRIAYEDPRRFGVDRWLTLIAAHAEFPGATLILDAGTAATFDLLLGDGTHLGGLILPGVEMMRSSLLAGTQIPRIESEPPGEQAWATDTGGAVAAASVQAIGALAGRLCDRLEAEAGVEPKLLLTGGDADRVKPVLDRPCVEEPDLVLKGVVQMISR